MTFVLAKCPTCFIYTPIDDWFGQICKYPFYVHKPPLPPYIDKNTYNWSKRRLCSLRNEQSGPLLNTIMLFLYSLFFCVLNFLPEGLYLGLLFFASKLSLTQDEILQPCPQSSFFMVQSGTV